MQFSLKVLDHGYVTVRNISGPTIRPERTFCADDTDPANVARMSFNAADKKDRLSEQDLKLVEYLMKNSHNTPIEMIEVWIEMKIPLFVARQFVRHRTVSINEVSARYTQLPNEFYIPLPETVGVQSSSNKQGRNTDSYNQNAEEYIRELHQTCQASYKKYEWAIDLGIPFELARLFLHVNIYTKWIWKQDIHNLMHFLSLRLHDHAQWEAREYAEAVYEILYRHLPKLMKLFDKYRRKEKSYEQP